MKGRFTAVVLCAPSVIVGTENEILGVAGAAALGRSCKNDNPVFVVLVAGGIVGKVKDQLFTHGDSKVLAEFCPPGRIKSIASHGSSSNLDVNCAVGRCVVGIFLCFVIGNLVCKVVRGINGVGLQRRTSRQEHCEGGCD